MIALLFRQACRSRVWNPIHVEHVGNLIRSASLIQWTEHFVRAFEATSKSTKASLPRPVSEIRDLRGGKSVLPVFRTTF